MRFAICLATLALLIGNVCVADNYQLEGVPFTPPTNVDVIWGIPVTNLPSNLWVYKVHNTSFSWAVISNLLRIGSLHLVNRQRNDQFMQKYDTNYMRFAVKNDKGLTLHMLNVSPSRGGIDYIDQSGEPKAPLEEGPSEQEVFQFANDFMFQAGIDRTEIDPKPRAGMVTTSQRANGSSMGPAFHTERGVMYQRIIDGVDERGSCLTINYGAHGKILSYQIKWRNLVPYEPCAIATTNEIVDFIRSGKAKLYPPDELGIVGQITRIKVFKFFPTYYSLPSEDYRPLPFEFPYAELVVEADYGNTNTVLYVNCPLIKN